MDAHKCSLWQSRQDFSEKHRRITVLKGAMAAIEKNHLVGPYVPEELSLEVFERFTDYLITLRIDVCTRSGIDGYDFGC